MEKAPFAGGPFRFMLGVSWQSTYSQMSFCLNVAAVKADAKAAIVSSLRCRLRRCPECGPRNKLRVIRSGVLGAPLRFLTLTYNANAPGTPAEKQRHLSRGISRMFQKLRRLYPGKTWEYQAHLEETEQGLPHYHILIRGPRIDWKWISDFMAAWCDSPIIFIEKIDSAPQAAYYVAKYISKAPVQFAGSRRWTKSRHYYNDPPSEDNVAADIEGDWFFIRGDIGTAHAEMLRLGAEQRGDGDTFRYYDMTHAYFPRGPDPTLDFKAVLSRAY